AGLNYVLSVNPKVKIYAPKEGFGVYGSSLPSSFYRKDASLPPARALHGRLVTWAPVPTPSHSRSLDQRRRPETLRTAMAMAFFWPTSTTNLFPRVIPV